LEENKTIRLPKIIRLTWACASQKQNFDRRSCPQSRTQMKIAFLTWITGQDGSYLAELLLAKSY
jgi:hypothetical protein